MGTLGKVLAGVPLAAAGAMAVPDEAEAFPRPPWHFAMMEALRRGEPVALDLGKISAQRRAQLARLGMEPGRAEWSVSPTQFQHLYEQRIQSGNMTPEALVDALNSNLHGSRARVAPNKVDGRATLYRYWPESEKLFTTVVEPENAVNGAAGVITGFPLKAGRLAGMLGQKKGPPGRTSVPSIPFPPEEVAGMQPARFSAVAADLDSVPSMDTATGKVNPPAALYPAAALAALTGGDVRQDAVPTPPPTEPGLEEAYSPVDMLLAALAAPGPLSARMLAGASDLPLSMAADAGASGLGDVLRKMRGGSASVSLPVLATMR